MTLLFLLLSVVRSLQLRPQLLRVGTHRYAGFAGMEHNGWPEIENTPGVLDWLSAQKGD